MKKYSDLIISEAANRTLSRNRFVPRVGMLRNFLIYNCGMADAINKLIADNSTLKNYNTNYQKPLSYLFQTGKYPDIKDNGGVYSTDKLNNLSRVLDNKGDWDPVNKLNTNSFDQADLLYDLYNKIGVYGEVGIIQNDTQLKRWILDFSKNNNLYDLIRKNLNFKDYTYWNRKNSLTGEIAENQVREMLVDKGCTILYQGGDGDFIDMIYGTDLIVSKNSKIYTVQVKSKEDAAKGALDGSGYANIDWFCSPTDAGIKIFTSKHADGKEVSKTPPPVVPPIF
jgi:hypothetical protein